MSYQSEGSFDQAHNTYVAYFYLTKFGLFFFTYYNISALLSKGFGHFFQHTIEDSDWIQTGDLGVTCFVLFFSYVFSGTPWSHSHSYIFIPGSCPVQLQSDFLATGAVEVRGIAQSHLSGGNGGGGGGAVPVPSPHLDLFCWYQGLN